MGMQTEDKFRQDVGGDVPPLMQAWLERNAADEKAKRQAEDEAWQNANRTAVPDGTA